MKKKLISLLIISTISSTYFTSKISHADTVENYPNGDNAVVENYSDTTKAANVKDNEPEAKEFDNSYINLKNIWGGNSLKILFNQNTMKIEAIAKSDNFGNSNNNFTFKLINKKNGQAILDTTANSKYVNNFTSKINNASFNYGDIVALNINKSSGLSNPTLYSNKNSTRTDCIEKTQFFEITKNGLINYTPHIDVKPLHILGEGTVTSATILGTTNPGNKVCVSVGSNNYYENADSKGNFSIKMIDSNGLNANTPIYVSVGEFKVSVYPQLSNKENMKQETITGYKYILNATLNELTKPTNSEVYYARTLLSKEGQKAWDLAYRTLLNYDNSDNKYPRDSQGNTIISIDYASKGININADDAQKIQKYLVRNCPKMFLLKDWPASPINKDGKVIGQKFYIGNGAQNGDDYHKQLLKTEKSVSEILSKIQPNMNIYQIIKAIQIHYENMVSYIGSGVHSDIRGTFIAHEAICGGYSKGYEYLLQRLGIEAIWVNGYAGGPHAWNFVNLYGNWYLSDTTWGGPNWYLNGFDSKFTENHKVYDTYDVMPKLAKDSIPWDIGNIDKNIVNLTGVVNYHNNNDGTITVTYNDSQNINKNIQINSSLNNWKPVDMKNDGNGLWSVTISNKSENKDINFFFTINDQYSTTGNIKENNLKTELLPNGMNNIVLDNVK
ncbi:hypothetical protein K5V21_17975 [Clostridium sardiniense]|uniref:Transglutaminase-like domain-containing protein n=1 Tax=Clostridium sardiniense TaxID=29369 RepID=A0ABS7L2L6_CLOSR|nr:hypothetical protein [Clostridium sardiniense]MBY0757321.1 hypothetical protein [Clostridium sardiniense]MDQ0461733.1 transglutaminase/protease-like cytokinesis protein 3 [Clostridium sardiniense]